MTLSSPVILLLGLAFFLGVWLGWRLSCIRARGVRPEPTREQLLTWMDQAPVGWLLVDGQNNVRFINARAERFLETPLSVRPARKLHELSNSRFLFDLIEDVRAHRQPQRFEWDFADQELEVFAFSGHQGSVALMLQSRRSLEAQLRQQELWVSDVAHELKTPLTALLLVGDSLAASVTSRNAVLVERLLKELKRMQELVGDLLELSRLENVLPGQGMRLESTNLKDLVWEAWQGVKPLADQKCINVRMRMDDAAAVQAVNVDRTRVHRALLNLFDNALRHSPEDGVISIDLQSNRDWIRVSIQDQGPGLSEQDLEHMFERFYRGDASRFRRQRGGSGLGLAIVQQIVLAHGGWVSGENGAEGGARFELRLPISATAGEGSS